MSTEEPEKDEKVDPFYTLYDQLFVEPQPSTLPTQVQLNSAIMMSRAECAVSRSHIKTWEQIIASKFEYSLILEDDIWFHSDFANNLNKVWNEIILNAEINGKFDILYLSYQEVKYGAPKTILSKHLFRPERGLWHLSGYVISREGAKKLLKLLPSRGPIDLWINHQFNNLNVIASRQSIIGQRRDIESSNSYSILPTLTKIGAITSESAALFNIRPIERPVFVFGFDESANTSVAMALSMLGYRCCSDLEDIPISEMTRLINGRDDRIFDSYVNIGSLYNILNELIVRYPKAKFIITSNKQPKENSTFLQLNQNLKGTDFTILYTDAPNKWKILSEHLRCAPPQSRYPELNGIGKRTIVEEKNELNWKSKSKKSRHDKSPWIIESIESWNGINCLTPELKVDKNENAIVVKDSFEYLDERYWIARTDTFTDNLALFRTENLKCISKLGAVLSIKKESLGVRNYSAASICSKDQYLYGKFEVTMQASNLPGVITGFFLYRNSPRQEIDIEILGYQPNRLLINVFYNPGCEGTKYDYGYRGSPCYIDLGFDASKESHRYAINWGPNEIQWLVDDKIVHRRVIWDPTPIPHLPMKLHTNIWITRSSNLAGKLKDHKLPTSSIINEIVIAANTIKTAYEGNIR
jgi:GR25 family glycosyltransferase involved in LPS biosynthesis